MTNPCDNRTVILDLKKYDFYIDKIQTLFVPSVEYRVYSLLKKFVCNADFQLIKQLSYFKRFIDAIVAWSDPLNGIAEYDTMTKRRNTVKHVMRNDLVTCFLDSVILYHRLSKICHELDSLGIEDNIPKSSNVWNFINQEDCTSFNNATDCNTNLEVMRFNDAREPVVCRKTTESLATNEIHHDESVKHVRPTMSKYRTQETQQNQQTLYSDQTFLQKEQDNMSTCDTSEPQNDVINKVYKSFNDKSCSIKLKKVQSASTLKIIVRKMCLENVPNPLKPIVIRLRLPCKPSDLIQCIFEIDPFLDESCLMRRKFQVSMYNVCSCLNDSLGKLGVKVTKSKLRLDCNIRPGYISFKLKADGASNADRHFFVARVPICQNVCQYTIQQDSAVSSRDSKLNIKTSVIRDKFNDTRMDEESDELNNTCCPCLDQSFVENLVLNTSQDKRENEEETICITDKVPKCFNDFTISSCDKVCENITKEISNVALHTDKLEEGNEEHCKILDSIEIKCHDGMETCKKNFHLSNLIVESEFIQSANDANYTYLSYDISIEANKDIINISSKNLKNSSHTTNVDEYKRVCPSDKESKEGNKYNDIDTCSITSFVQNSDRDKQLVELNYNRFLQNDTKMINEQSRTKDNSLLNSIKAETECECSNCPRQHDDFINITAIDNISRESIVYVFDAFRDDLNAIETRSTSYLDTMKTSSKNNLLTVFDQMPRLIISSKGINVDISYQSAVWLAFDNDTDVSITTKKCDNCKEVTDSSTRNLTVPKRENKNFYDDIDIEKRSGRMQRSVKSFDRPFISKKKFRSSKEFKRSDISTNECLRANNSSTYVTSEASCSSRLIAITSDFTTSENRDKFQKSCKLRKSCGYGCFDNSITSIKYETTAQYQDDYFADVRPRTTFMMTKFRNSVHKSVNRIKRLIRAKLFNKKAGMTLILKNKFWKNMGFFKDTKQETRKYIRQGYGMTSCPTYDYYKQNCTVFSPESNVLLIHKNRGSANSEEGMKLYDHGLSDSSEVLSSFRSITQISPLSYDLLTFTPENFKERKLNSDNQQRFRKERNTKNKQKIANYNENSRHCDFRNSRTNVTISSSAEISFAEDYPIHHEYTRKRKRKTCDEKYVCERMRNRWKARYMCTCHRRLYEKILPETSSSSSHVYERKPENMHEQFYRVFRLKNLKKFPSSKNNRQMGCEKKNTSDHSDNDCLCRKCAFMFLTRNYKNYVNDVDLDFKLTLLRYVELCKNVKRALMRITNYSN